MPPRGAGCSETRSLQTWATGPLHPGGADATALGIRVPGWARKNKEAPLFFPPAPLPATHRLGLGVGGGGIRGRAQAAAAAISPSLASPSSRRGSDTGGWQRSWPRGSSCHLDTAGRPGLDKGARRALQPAAVRTRPFQHRRPTAPPSRRDTGCRSFPPKPPAKAPGWRATHRDPHWVRRARTSTQRRCTQVPKCVPSSQIPADTHTHAHTPHLCFSAAIRQLGSPAPSGCPQPSPAPGRAAAWPALGV